MMPTQMNEKHRASLGCCTSVIVYSVTALVMFILYGGMHYENNVPASRPYDSDIGMFAMSEEKIDVGGKLIELKEVSGFMMEIKITICGFEDGTKTCTISYKDYPAAMTFVYIAFLWMILINLLVPIPVMTLLFYKAKHTHRIKQQTVLHVYVGFLICIFIVHALGYFVYIHVIGEEIGFTWEDLTGPMYIGLANACTSPVLVVYLFLSWRKRLQGRFTYDQSIIYRKFDKKKTKVGHKMGQTPDGKAMSEIETTFDFHQEEEDKTRSVRDIKTYIEKVWKPQKVGIGRDARGLYHSSINIINIIYIGHENMLQRYLKRKKQIEHFAGSVGGKLFPIESYLPGLKPVQTLDLLKGSHDLALSVNCDINEHYLFHGTPIENMSSIERTGFDMDKARYSMLGRGVYFTEDPVKADQYTGKSKSDPDPFCCMLLCRVLLGDSVFQRNIGKPVIKSDAFTPPCKKCLKPNRTCHCSHATHFDSVIFEGKLFREFVVYENAQTFPEFAVIYKRVKTKQPPLLFKY